MAALASEGLRDSDAYIALKNGDILIQTWKQENAHTSQRPQDFSRFRFPNM